MNCNRNHDGNCTASSLCEEEAGQEDKDLTDELRDLVKDLLMESLTQTEYVHTQKFSNEEGT